MHCAPRLTRCAPPPPPPPPPHNRYWPDNPRLKQGIRPGRYGSMAGAKKLWYDYLAAFEGGGLAPPKK